MVEKLVRDRPELTPLMQGVGRMAENSESARVTVLLCSDMATRRGASCPWITASLLRSGASKSLQ
jgi:hypothetical protein